MQANTTHIPCRVNAYFVLYYNSKSSALAPTWSKVVETLNHGAVAVHPWAEKPLRLHCLARGTTASMRNMSHWVRCLSHSPDIALLSSLLQWAWMERISQSTIVLVSFRLLESGPVEARASGSNQLLEGFPTEYPWISEISWDIRA